MAIDLLYNCGTVDMSSGSPKSLKLPTGGTHHKLMIRIEAATGTMATKAQVAAAIEHIKVEAVHAKEGNIDLVPESTPAELDVLTDYYGTDREVRSGNGIIRIDPVGVWGKEERFRKILVWGTADVKSLKLTVKYKSDADAVAALGEVKVVSEYAPAQVQPLGLYKQIHRDAIRLLAKTGKIECKSLATFDKNSAIAAIHIFEASGAEISKISMTQNTTDKFADEWDRDICELWLKDHHRTPQPGVFSLDFAKKDTKDYALQAGMEELKLEPYLKTAPAAVIDAVVLMEVLHVARDGREQMTA